MLSDCDNDGVLQLLFYYYFCCELYSMSSHRCFSEGRIDGICWMLWSSLNEQVAVQNVMHFENMKNEK